MLPAPPAIQAPPPPAQLADLLGVPYVADAVTDGQGRWVTFADPGRSRNRPGLNCSGFVVAAARRLLGFAGSPAEAARDRQGDSGPGAHGGRDWDFGWDLVLNLSEGRPRRWLLPSGEQAVVAGDAAAEGFAVQDAAAWRAIHPRMRAERVYLAAFLRRRAGAAFPLYHHVALLLKGPAGSLWLYQTLPGGRVRRLEISRPEGFDRLRKMFGPRERIRILEVESRVP